MTADRGHEPGFIQSFVFLDMEASGLFPVDAMNPLDDPPIPGNQRDLTQILRNHIRLTSSSQAPHTMEICLMSATRKAVFNGIRRMQLMTQDFDPEPSGPNQSNFRIPCNIYTAQVKPKMSQAEWTEYEKGRYHCSAFAYALEELEDKNDFTTEWRGVKLFLEQTPKPACLIAHNGLRFDFRVLHAEFERNDLLNSCPIPDQIYFIDSYLMFMDLEKKMHDELRTAVRLLDWGHLLAQIKAEDVPSSPEKEVSSHAVSATSQIESNTVPGTSAVVQICVTVPASGNNSSIGHDGLESATLVVPPESPSTRVTKRHARRRLFAETADHPLNFIRTTLWSPAKKKRVRPNLFKRSGNEGWVFNNHCSVAYFRERSAFKLQSMYKQLLNDDYDAHFAENDCEALLKICLQYGYEFVEYVDKHGAKFPF